MPATETLTITVKTAVLKKWKASAREQGYESVNSMIEDALIRCKVRELPDQESAYWFERTIADRCHEADAKGLNLSCEDIRIAVATEAAENKARYALGSMPI